MEGIVLRCANCAAPLGEVKGGVASCAYCGAENHPGMTGTQSGAVLFAAAAREADALIAENEAKLAELEQRYTRLMSKAIESGSAETGKRALEAFEGYLRLTYAPTVHLYRSMSPADPNVSSGLAQIDEAIDQALAAFAEALPCDYVPVAERLNKGGA